jgi:hypothetical protein
MKVHEAEAAITKILDALEKTNDCIVRRIEIEMLENTNLYSEEPSFVRQVKIELLRKGGWL